METKNNLLKAKLLFQQYIQSIERTSSVDFETRNGGRKSYEYVDLAAVMDYALPLLAECGLVLSSRTVENHIFNERKAGDGAAERVFVRSVMGVEVTLYHAETGENESNTVWHDKEMADIKDRGAMLTYLRRYAIMILLNLSAAGEDDDGGAGGKKKGPAPQGNAAPPKQSAPRPAPQGNAAPPQQSAPRPAPVKNEATGKDIPPKNQEELKQRFNAIGLTDQEMLDLREAGVRSMADALHLYEKSGKDKAKMLKAALGEGSQEADTGEGAAAQGGENG
jgi:hypothetical protein